LAYATFESVYTYFISNEHVQQAPAVLAILAIFPDKIIGLAHGK
jgi:hypothetical protein